MDRMENKAARQVYKRGPPLADEFERSVTDQSATSQGALRYTGNGGVGLNTSHDAHQKRQHVGPAMHRGLDTPNSPWSTPENSGPARGQPGFVNDSTRRGSGQNLNLPNAALRASAWQAAGQQQCPIGIALLEYCTCTRLTRQQQSDSGCTALQVLHCVHSMTAASKHWGKLYRTATHLYTCRCISLLLSNRPHPSMKY